MHPDLVIRVVLVKISHLIERTCNSKFVCNKIMDDIVVLSENIERLTTKYAPKFNLPLKPNEALFILDHNGYSALLFT